MQRKERKRRKPKKKKIKINKEFTKDEADVRALMKARETTAEIGPNSDDEIDFFCRVHTEDDDNRSAESSQGNLQEVESQLIETPTALLASAYVNIEAANPICRAKFEKVTKDGSLLYSPSAQRSQRLDEAIRDSIEEDGIYTGNFQILEGTNVNCMVNRYLEEGYEGDLMNIVKVRIPCDQIVRTYSDVSFQPIYVPPTPLHEMIGHDLKRSVIVVHLKDLIFTNHPLFSEENTIAMKLKSSYETYKNLVMSNSIPKLTSELTALRSVLNDYLETDEPDKRKLKDYSQRIHGFRKQLHTQERILKEATLDCIEYWKQLKAVRKKQEYSSTNIKLSIQLVEKDIEIAQKLWDERFAIELNEMMREAFDEYYKNKKRGHKGHLKKPNVDDIKDKLMEMFEVDLQLPDEPEVMLELNQIAVTKKSNEQSKVYYVKIALDNNVVCNSKDLKLNDNFILNFEETFSITLESKMPEMIKFQIYEKHTFWPDQKIAEAQSFTPQSESFKISKELEFSSEKLALSGNLKFDIFSEDENFNNNLVQGKWQLKDQRYFATSSLLKSNDNDETPSDTESNRNSIARDRSKRKDSASQSNDFTFTEDLISFCTKSEFDNIKRFQVLSARYRNEYKFKDRRFVPTFDKELEEETKEPAIEEIDWLDPIDVHKHKGKKYMKNLYQLVLDHCERLNRNEDAENLIVGDEAHTLSSIISTLAGLFRSNRPLNPIKSTPVTVQADSCTKFNVIVNVIRATGVPYRQFSTNFPSMSRRSSTNSLTYQVTKPSNVKPYISVHCKDKFLRTIAADGSNPTWNEQLVLQINRDQLESKDHVTFELFDEYIEDLMNDELARASEVYQRIHTNWIGELKFPLTTILSKLQIEGTFELDSPKILLGYTMPSLGNEEDIINVENTPEIKKAIHLYLNINVEPHLEIPSITMSHLECSELTELKNYIQESCFEVKEMFPERFIHPLISIATGNRVCITRLLEPLPLPFEVNDESESMIRRYASLFPIFRTTSNCTGLQGVWFNNQIILDSSWVSAKDLGVLLCCFYLSLEIQAVLVLGVAYPHGDATFVLVKESSEYFLVDPTSGRKYSSSDAFCPLIKVFCAIRDDNIFFNIQSESRVSMTDFNVEDKRNWLPLFNKKHPAPTGGVHNMNYIYRDPYNIENLQKAIERKIMKKINSWRPNRKTIWNRAFKDMLYNVLIELERDALFDRDENVYIDRITKRFPDYKIFGFTRNFSYTNLSAISERVKATGIHLNTDKNVEFSVAVHIQQYPNNILSIWIFIITATPVNS